MIGPLPLAPAGGSGLGMVPGKERIQSMKQKLNVHTPGPWNVLPWFAPGGAEITTVQALNRTVADCPGEDETAKANARLIAAAPDLLAALERLEAGVRLWISHGVSDEDMAAARAAIAKARGEAHEAPCD